MRNVSKSMFQLFCLQNKFSIMSIFPFSNNRNKTVIIGLCHCLPNYFSYIYMANKDLLKHSCAYLFIICDGFFAMIAELMDVKETTWVSDLESTEELSQNIKSLTNSLSRLLHKSFPSLSLSCIIIHSLNTLFI